MPSGNRPGRDGAVTVGNAWLREVLAETIVKRHFGRHHPDDDAPLPKRFGVVQLCCGVRVKKQGAWFAVTEREVRRARLRAFRAGVTFATYMDFHLLRRNYEADPTVLRRGLWSAVHRDPPPSLPRELTLFWTKSGISLMAFVDQFDRMPADAGTGACAMRQVIISIIADMCRPLAPRRSRTRTPRRARGGASIDK